MNNLTTDEIIKLMEKAKELGCYSFTLDKLHFVLGPAVQTRIEREKDFQADAIENSIPDKIAEDLVKPMPVLDQLTDQEILYYATPYYDELQAQKEAHAKKLAEEVI